jgi:hypothetical protein
MIQRFIVDDLEPGMVTGFRRAVILSVTATDRKVTRSKKQWPLREVRLRERDGSITSYHLTPFDPFAIVLNGDGEPLIVALDDEPPPAPETGPTTLF